MIAMANEGYDTCPLEGFDSKRIKKVLKLPHGAGINMVIPCGIRNGNKGIWGERGRVPVSYTHLDRVIPIVNCKLSNRKSTPFLLRSCDLAFFILSCLYFFFFYW